MLFGEFDRSTKIGLSTALVIAACVVDSVTIAYDGSVMGSVNTMPSYNKYFSIDTTLEAVNSTATSLGGILISVFAGFIIDGVGRRPSLLIASIINIIGAAITAASQDIGMFISGRMIVGLGMGLAATAAGTYVSETTAPHVRAFALGLYYSCWAIGGMLATGIAYGCADLEPSNWAWRVPSLFQALAPLLLIALYPWLPESPRWLISRDRLDEGLKVIAWINGSTIDDAEVQEQYREMTQTLNYEKTEGKSIAFLEIVRNAPNRRRLTLALSIAPITMLTGSNIITYYYGTMLSQAGITSSKTQMEINLVLSAWQFVVAIVGCFYADKIGRRMLCLGSLAGCTVMFYIVGALTAVYGDSNDNSAIYGTVAAIFLFLGFYSFGLTPLTQMYPPEVLSFPMRATGMALFTFLNKASSIFCTMVFPYMFEAVGWKTYVINASWNFLFIAYVYFFWVETKQKTLEEINVLFDGHVAQIDGKDLKDPRISESDVKGFEVDVNKATEEV